MTKKGVYTYVESEGPLDAKVVILGESPWINEVEAGRPFAGASGNLMKRWWGPLGLNRTEMRLMNLFPWRPPTRDIESVPVDRLAKAIEGVHERIARLVDPYVIIPMGNYATYALTGKGKVKAAVRSALHVTLSASDAEKKAGITSLRGSIYPYQDLNGRLIKVIPMIHPAAVLQMPKWEKRSIADWGRVKREAGFREIRDPGRVHVIEPSQAQVEEFCHEVYVGGGGVRMSVDIETWGNTLSCVGFALSPWKSITIPTTGKWKGMIEYVKWLCESEAQKVLCNGGYDWYWLDAEGVDGARWLYQRGIQLRNYWRDVQAMHHALDPAESHSLDFLASVYCPHYVYWKDEAKEAEEIVKYVKDLQALWVYNGLDVCYTRELDDVLEAELRREGMWDFYLQHYGVLFEPLLRTMRYGIKVDVKAQREQAKVLRGELKGLHAELNALAGVELFATLEKTELRSPSKEEWQTLLLDKDEYASLSLFHLPNVEGVPPAKAIDREARKRLIDEQGLTYMMSGKNAGMMRFKKTILKKDFSNDKLLEFFYGQLGLPRQFKLRKGKEGKTRTESLDEDSLRKLMYKYPKAIEPGKLLLEYREKKKELDYLVGAWDKDGRVRCSYKLNTKAGRLSSSKNPMRRGMNLQNLKR